MVFVRSFFIGVSLFFLCLLSSYLGVFLVLCKFFGVLVGRLLSVGGGLWFFVR